MKTKTRSRFDQPESPAHRLGVLYVASLSAIAILSAISHYFILRELDWQGRALRSIADSAERRSLARPLGLTVLALQAAADPGERQRHAASLREAVQKGARELAGPAEPGSHDLSRAADVHRRAALRTAETLLATLGPDGSGPDPAHEVAPLVLTIDHAEDAARRAIAQAVLAAERDAGAHLRRLQSLETILFAFVMVVLFFEGLFVISPAVRKIQLFMAEMSKSHEALSNYAAKLERSNKELQDFASVASHDLQEPLRKVQAFSDRLKSKYARSIDDQGRDYLDRIQNAASRMQTLINDLLTYSRVTTKAKPFVPIDLAASTREVVSDLEVRIEQVKGRVEVGEMSTVDADPLQVRQLMQNLIGNALKYHRPEERPVVKVSSKITRKDPASPLLGPPHDFCQIMVEDNGIGFEEIYTERIFAIFQRLHARTEYEGTGVGLAVCKKIAERHGGSITARSTPGKGSTFLVTLPVRQPKETTPDGSAN
jgi:signal transduction histidine kinase